MKSKIPLQKEAFTSSRESTFFPSKFGNFCFLKDECNLYGFGLNTKFRLGLNKKNELYEKFTKIDCFSEDFCKTIVSVNSGSNFSIIQTKTDGLFLIGENVIRDDRPLKICQIRELVRIDNCKNHNISLVSCGYDHVMVLTKDSRVYAGGKNEKGKLGLSDSPKEYRKMTEIRYFTNKKIKIIKVQCGMDFSLFLSNLNEFYATGNNTHKQLGIDNTEMISIPTKVKFSIDTEMGKITDFECGGYHTLFLTDKKKVFSFGNGSHFRLGNGSNIDIFKPQKINGNYDKIRVGFDSNLLSNGNKIYGFGNNKCFILGIYTKDEYVIGPKMIKELEFKDYFAGLSNSYIIEKTGNILVCGKKVSNGKTMFKEIIKKEKKKKLFNIFNIFNIFNFLGLEDKKDDDKNKKSVEREKENFSKKIREIEKENELKIKKIEKENELKIREIEKEKENYVLKIREIEKENALKIKKIEKEKEDYELKIRELENKNKRLIMEKNYLSFLLHNNELIKKMERRLDRDRFYEKQLAQDYYFRSLLKGKSFEDFKILEKIGGKNIGKEEKESEGNNSIVFKVNLKNQGDFLKKKYPDLAFAIKILRITKNQDPYSRKYSEKDTQYVNQKTENEIPPYHQNVISPLLYFKHDLTKDDFNRMEIKETLFEDYLQKKTGMLVMDCFESNLKAFREELPVEKNNRIIERDVFLDISIQICKGINHLNSCGIVHRDLKPANIFIKNIKEKESEFYYVVIGDLGESFNMVNFRDLIQPYKTDHINLRGAPFFFPPEIHESLKKGKGWYNVLNWTKSDSFALGLTLYSMLSKNDPFGGAKPRNRSKDNYVKLEHQVGKDICSIINKLCDPVFESRISAGDALRKLENLF